MPPLDPVITATRLDREFTFENPLPAFASLPTRGCGLREDRRLLLRFQIEGPIFPRRQADCACRPIDSGPITSPFLRPRTLSVPPLRQQTRPAIRSGDEI